MKKIREKKHRLELSYYKGEKTVAFTLCVKNRMNILNSNQIFEIFEEIFLDVILRKNCEALIYLFMPDHLHLILQGKEETSNVIAAVNEFKQISGFWFYNNNKRIKWQKDYYDHMIRNSKDIRNQINYILNNPVRSGLTENWKEYRFNGSSVYCFDEWG